MTEPALVRVERACAQLLQAGQQITFVAVADLARVGRATLYRNPQLRAVINEHRTQQADARTLSGLAHELAHLRTALEAVADNVRRHEEALRRLERRTGLRPRSASKTGLRLCHWRQMPCPATIIGFSKS
jgi:DNA polymerase III epsilon subunit-like protein